jgi:FAD/FMN-containing dehydrogenase
MQEAFAEFRPRRIEAALGDFSGLRSGAAGYWELAPRNAGTAQRIVQAAYAHGVPLRVRAQGHSLNGASLPHGEELLLSTRNLRHLRFEQSGSVTAGGGVVLWILQ